MTAMLDFINNIIFVFKMEINPATTYVSTNVSMTCGNFLVQAEKSIGLQSFHNKIQQDKPKSCYTNNAIFNSLSVVRQVLFNDIQSLIVIVTSGYVNNIILIMTEQNEFYNT